MKKQKAVSSFFSAVLVGSLLLLNFSVVTYRVAAVEAERRAEKGETASARKAQLSLLVQRAHDSQDPETTGSRCAIRQVIGSNQLAPALLSLAGGLPVCLKGWSLTRISILSGSDVRRNSERIAEFLHDLAAAL